MITQTEWPGRHSLQFSRSSLFALLGLIVILAASSSARAATIVVPAGGNFQAALNVAARGDVIILQGGASYPTTASFVLPNKGVGTGTDADYVTIQTSNLAGIALPGQRIDPAIHAQAMPKLVGAMTGGYPIVTAAPGANYYRFVGIEITTNGNPSVFTTDLVTLGSYFTRQQRLDTHHIAFDRVFIHPAELTAGNLFPTTRERTSGRGIGGNITELWVTNSYIAGFAGYYPSATSNAGLRVDSYGVYSDAGPGPIHIVNNYIEAEFNNVFIGGAGQETGNSATISNATVSSVTLSNVNNLQVGDLVAFAYSACTTNPNPRAKPWQTGRINSINGNNVTYTAILGQNSCVPGAPDNNGVARWRGDNIHDVEIRGNTLNKPDVWNVWAYPKAWIEIKGTINLDIDGNDMYSGLGTANALTVRNEDGASPWCTIDNVRITNNRMRGWKWGFSLMMTDNEQPSTMGGNLLLKNNLLYDAKPIAGAAANFLQIVGGHHISIEHNTVLQPGSPVSDELPTPNFVFKDNIINNGIYGMQCLVPPYSMQTCWSGMVMIKNVVIGPHPVYGRLSCDDYPGNLCANTINDVGFVDPANNFQLGVLSAFRNAASDGTDVGADMVALLAALGGNPLPLPSPTPTPSVTPTPSPTPTPLPTPTPSPSPSPTPSPSPSPTPTPVAGTTASFIRVDTTTQGNWRGVYGIDGHNVINDSAMYPSYVQVTPNSQTSHLWTGTSSENRALQRLNASNRIAACWYSTSQFSVDVNFTDGQVHQLALYGLDWDDNGRVQRIDILDATSNALLDSRTLSSFRTGRYVVWNIRGHVRINVVRTSGANGVISGLFFSPITPSTPISPASVDRARVHAGNLVNNFPLANYPGAPDPENTNVDALVTADLEALTTDIGLAYQDFNNERNMFGAVATRIELQLWGALYFSRAQAALAAKTGATTAVRNHLLRIVSHLAMAQDLMLTGAISPATGAQAAAVNARIDVLIGPALAGYAATSPALLAPLSMGSVFGDPVASPLSSQTLFGAIGSDGSVPYELAGVSVTVSGKAVPVLYVSPSRVSFHVAPDVVQGTVEVIVTSQDGFVSRGTTTIVRNATRLMTATDNDNGTAIALNASSQTVASFAAITPGNFGSDKRTRVQIYATGISGSAVNSNPANDIVMGGLVRPNFAETVRVEARKSNGTVINLPVEFAGIQGLLPGLDQVNVVITSPLAGAGTVQLTLIVGGQRSNAPTIVVLQ